jgi:hypothetical protein
MAYDIMAVFNGVFPDWTTIAGILLLFAAVIAGLIYIVGIFISNEKIKSWAKIELVEVVYSGILLVVILALLVSANLVVQEIAISNKNIYDPYGFSTKICADGPGTFGEYEYFKGIPCHIRLAMVYLNNLFNEGRINAYGIYQAYIFTSAIAEMNINLEGITEQAGVFAYNPLKGFFVVGNTIKSSTFDYTTKIMTINKFQEVFLRLIAVALFPALLILGLTLRCFFFTRRLGGLLMALAIALFFIFPLFYVLGGWTYNNYKVETCLRYMAEKQVSACPPDISAFGSLTVDLSGFPTLDGTPISQGKLNAAGANNGYGTFTGSTTGKGMDQLSILMPGNSYAMKYINTYFDPSQNTNTPNYHAPNICAIMDDAAVKAQIGDGQFGSTVDGALNQQKKNIFDMLKAKNLYDKAAFIAEVYGTRGMGGSYGGGYIDMVSKLTFFSLFFSFLGVMATIAAVKSLSGIFGGDLEIAGLTHLI